MYMYFIWHTTCMYCVYTMCKATYCVRYLMGGNVCTYNYHNIHTGTRIPSQEGGSRPRRQNWPLLRSPGLWGGRRESHSIQQSSLALLLAPAVTSMMQPTSPAVGGQACRPRAFILLLLLLHLLRTPAANPRLPSSIFLYREKVEIFTVMRKWEQAVDDAHSKRIMQLWKGRATGLQTDLSSLKHKHQCCAQCSEPPCKCSPHEGLQYRVVATEHLYAEPLILFQLLRTPAWRMHLQSRHAHSMFIKKMLYIHQQY